MLSKKSPIPKSYNQADSFVGVNIPKRPGKEAWKGNKKLKDFIRNHLSIVQDDKCAYCFSEITITGKGEQIDHIVPKSHQKNWMFHPRNLCLTCFGCNNEKKSKPTLAQTHIAKHSKTFKDYNSLKSKDFLIFHPYFDKWGSCINDKDIYYRGKDAKGKGKNTIDICDLNRTALLYERARARKISNNALKQMLEKLRNKSTFSKEEKTKLLLMINDIIERSNYRRNMNNPKNHLLT